MSTEGGLNTPKNGGAHRNKCVNTWAVTNTKTSEDLNARNCTVHKNSETLLLIQNGSVIPSDSPAESYCLADTYDGIDGVDNAIITHSHSVQNIQQQFIEPIGDAVLNDGEWLNTSKMCIEPDSKGDATPSNVTTGTASPVEMVDGNISISNDANVHCIDSNTSMPLGLASELFEESDLSFPLSRTSSHDSTITSCNISDTHNFDTSKTNDVNTDTVAENVGTEILTDVDSIPVNAQQNADTLSLLEMESARKPVLMCIGSSYLERSKSILEDLETLVPTAEVEADKDVYIVTNLQGIPVDFSTMPEPDRNNLLMMPQELEKLSDECLDCLDTLDDMPLHDQPKLYNLSGASAIHSTSFIDECSNGSKLESGSLASSAEETQMHSIRLIGNHNETNIESHVLTNTKSTTVDQVSMPSNIPASLPNMVSKLLSDDIEYDRSIDLNSSLETAEEHQTVNTSPLVTSSNSVATFQISGVSMPDTNVETAKIARATVAATISIKTNKFQKSTQITVNTPRGQQCYELNIDELLQANTMLLAMPPKPDAVNADGTRNTHGTSQTQIGYLLVPVDKFGHVKQQPAAKENEPTKETSDSPDTVQRLSRKGKTCVCDEPGCGKEFQRHAKLLIHQMSHTGERPYKCPVPGCRWAFSTLYKLRRHEETHGGKKDFVCDHDGCSQCFTTIYNLRTHKKLHERELTEYCPVDGCGGSFATKRKLDLHMKTHPTFRRSYQCPHDGCDKVFYSSTSMGSHARVHAMPRMDLTCQFEGCGRVFQRLFLLKEHSRTHTGIRPYVCIFEGCGWAFISASKLQRHMNKHTGTRKFVCPVEGCGKAFMRNDHLKGHLPTHSGERPFACHIEGCKARFTAKCSLYMHIKKHNQGSVSTYLCPMDNCTKKYSTKACLRNHIHKHYLNIANADSRAEASSNFDFLLGGTEDMSNTSLEDIKPTAGLQEQRCISESLSPDVMSQLSPSLVTQLIATSELAQNSAQVTGVPITTDAMEIPVSMVSILPSNQITVPQLTGQVSLISGMPVISDATSLSDSTLISVTAALENDQALAAVVDAETHVLQENNSGSARTDYRSNHLMIDRVKKKRQLLRERSLSMGDLTCSLTGLPLVEPGSLALSLLPPTSDATSFTGLVDLPAPPTIMFRCPVTGTIFTQTQLLQDDPPSVELFADSVTLSSELAALQSTPPDNAMTTQFTGTTINLQDLE